MTRCSAHPLTQVKLQTPLGSHGKGSWHGRTRQITEQQRSMKQCTKFRELRELCDALLEADLSALNSTQATAQGLIEVIFPAIHAAILSILCGHTLPVYLPQKDHHGHKLYRWKAKKVTKSRM